MNHSRLASLIEDRLNAVRSINPDQQRMEEINFRLAEVDASLESIKDSIEKGLPVNFIKDRIDKLSKEQPNADLMSFHMSMRWTRLMSVYLVPEVGLEPT